MPLPTARELRTLLVNRLFGDTAFLELASAAKWAVFPRLAKVAPRLAIATHEPESTGEFWDAMREGMIVFDCGANRGGYSVLASLKVGPAGQVFAFEPEPDNFRKLSEKLRPYPNVYPVQAAIAGRVGTATLNLDDFHAGHSLTDRPKTGRSVEVPVTTLDAFIEERGLPGVDVIKLDIEGSELEAMEGMKKLLTGPRRPVILCEVHPPITPEQMGAALERFGYRFRLLDGRMTGAVHEVPVHLSARPT